MRAVHWTTDYTGATGNSLGYAYHDANSKRALEQAGVELRDDAPVAVHALPPHRFEPVAGKKNIAYCAWEARELPKAFENLRQADAVCLTAEFLLEPFREMLGPETPVYHVPLGVHADKFPFVNRLKSDRLPIQRRGSKRPFRFLWVGAPNSRKGCMHVAEAFKVFAGDDRFELYMKTTVPEDVPEHKIGVQRIGNIIYDNRKVPLDELVRIYHKAHAFVFPSVAEGFGLTAIEAASTGLPVLCCQWSSLPDLFPGERYCYPIAFAPQEMDWSWKDSDGRGTPMEVHVTVANPDTFDLAKQMIAVTKDYPTAVAKGKLASERARTVFTWERTGKLLRQVVERMYAQIEVQGEDVDAGRNCAA